MLKVSGEYVAEITTQCKDRRKAERVYAAVSRAVLRSLSSQ
jgi:hypothetical protein